MHIIVKGRSATPSPHVKDPGPRGSCWSTTVSRARACFTP